MAEELKNEIVVLNDCETFTNRAGCFVAEVIFDGFGDNEGDNAEQEYRLLEDAHYGEVGWFFDGESMLIARRVRFI